MTTATASSHRAQREFGSDNTAGTPTAILETVAAAAAGLAAPYGADSWTDALTRQLGEVFDHPVDIALVSTGTAANAISLATLTPSWGSVLCHRDSHIHNDENTAPELFTGGARLTPLDGADAKIDSDELRAAVDRKSGDLHKAKPATLSITQATEAGGVYTPGEIHQLTIIAQNAGLRVHMDGARFANALVALGCRPAELTWQIGVDMLSFGTTKNGTMTAEAIILFDPDLATELGYRTKRAGQLTSKARFQAAQLHAYLTDDLWLHNATHANAMADRLRAGLSAIPTVHQQGNAEANITFYHLPQPVIDGLLTRGFNFHANRWGPQVARFVTSFATTPDDIDALIDTIDQLTGRVHR
ncbi:threonine aldolase family protein [Nocardia sp. NPDC057030]|uniref:threonine aldolase family protein n=1 Tax=unclassified Nocardia TaxID=2637762 RepID=UPI00362C6C8E